MKIIKRGTPPEKKVIRFTCKNCKSELEAFVSEGRYEGSCRNESYLVFKCLICNKDCWVEQ